MARAKVRPCKEPDCTMPCMKGRQRCGWHWLALQPPEAQTNAADRRRSRTPEDRRRSRVPAAEWPEGARWCSGCQSYVPLFYVRGSRCRACSSAASHGRAVEKKYGITAAQYRELLRIQGGRCAICRQASRTIRLAVDHDHETGEVRGLLCASGDHGCNKGLGFFKDDAALLLRAHQYLVDPPARQL